MAQQRRKSGAPPGLGTVLAPPAETALARLTTPATQLALQQLLAQLAPDEHQSTYGMIHGEQTKYVTWRFPETLGTIELLQLTDVQFGHICCRVNRVLEYRDWVLAKPNRFLLFCGDMIDSWALWSPGSAFDQLGNPAAQLYRFVEMWAPARHRILGYVGGNHEARAIPAFGDLGALLAILLRVPYSAGEQHLDIHFGKHEPFTVTLWHGRGSAQTLGGIAQMLERFAERNDSQLSLCGHLHRPLIAPLWKKMRGRNHQMILQKRIVGIGSSFLEHWNSYAEVKGLRAHDVLMVRAVLESDGRWECTLR